MLSIDPEQQLSFQRPFTQEVVKCPLTLTNTASPTAPGGKVTGIVFKIKTTAPKTYCVRPNAGLLMPGESKTVSVMLQPMESDPPLDFKCKDKFLVLGLAVSQDGLAAVQTALNGSPQQVQNLDLWSLAERFKNSDSASVEKKLRVAFLPVGGAPGSVGAAGSGSVDVAGSSSSLAVLAPAVAAGGNEVLGQLEHTLREKDDEIKRLQKLCQQYKSTQSAAATKSTAKSSSALGVLISDLVLILLGALMAVAVVNYYGGKTGIDELDQFVRQLVKQFSQLKK